MRYEDWRLATPAEVAPLLAAEAERWASGLDWDIGPSLVQAERGRRNGRIPGFIARGASGASTGFTFFSVDRGVLSLGILAGERADVVRELLDLVLESPEAAFARRYQGFLFPRSGTVAVALTRRRFVLAPQCFLARPTATPLPCPAPAGRPWAEDDLANVVTARLTAGLFIVAAHLAGEDAKRAWQIWRRDSGQTASPNAGHPMSAAAGALGVELGKVEHYRLGAGGRAPAPADIRRALRLMYMATGLVVGLPLVWQVFTDLLPQRRRRNKKR